MKLEIKRIELEDDSDAVHPLPIITFVHRNLQLLYRM
jgi:hypothetical protein